jgi:hypothetical protein
MSRFPAESPIILCWLRLVLLHDATGLAAPLPFEIPGEVVVAGEVFVTFTLVYTIKYYALLLLDESTFGNPQERELDVASVSLLPFCDIVETRPSQGAAYDRNITFTFISISHRRRCYCCRCCFFT